MKAKRKITKSLTVFIIYCCVIRLPPTYQLNTVHAYSFTVSADQESRCSLPGSSVNEKSGRTVFSSGDQTREGPVSSSRGYWHSRFLEAVGQFLARCQLEPKATLSCPQFLVTWAPHRAACFVKPARGRLQQNGLQSFVM